MTIESIRKRINAIDKVLVQLITDRMACSDEIGRLKSDAAKPVRDRVREKEILDRVTAESGDLEVPLRIIFESIFAQSRQVQMDILGGQDTFGADIATTQTKTPFPSSASIAYRDSLYTRRAVQSLFADSRAMTFSSHEKIASAVDHGLCDFGLLPIEDNRTGAHEATYQHLRDNTAHIVRTIRLHLNYDLFAPDTLPLEKVRTLVADPLAITHTSKFLQRLENVEILPVDHPDQEVLKADPEEKTAYILPPKTQVPEGMISLRQSIVNRGDYVRFICIAPQAIIYPQTDRMSLLLSTDDTPGGLGEVLARFAALNINLTLLESRPTKVGMETFHRFFIDLEASIDDPMVQAILGQLHRDASVFRFLGSYKQIEVTM